MSDDLVKRLRTEGALAGHYGPPAIQVEAADRIEALEAALRMVRVRYRMVRSDEIAVNRALEGSND